MLVRKFARIPLFLLGLVSASASWAADYELDDGSAESSVGCGNCSVIWLNAFQAIQGADHVTDVEIAFGANINADPPPDGDPITVYLWRDPTNDGDPSDAVVVDSVPGTIQSSHTDTFVNFVFPIGASFAVGEWFYVGFRSTDFAVGRDESIPHAGRSWISAWTAGADPSNLSGADVAFGETTVVEGGAFAGDFLIRANGIPAGPPEPVPSMSAWGLGVLSILLGLMGIRARRAS
ncbi:MAG: IPTL-CTERM sorting domain-containing protein [bacterium]